MHQARTVLGIVICVIIALESSPKLAHKQKGPVLLNTYHPHIPGPQKVLSGHTADKQWKQNSHPGFQPSEYLVTRGWSLW